MNPSHRLMEAAGLHLTADASVAPVALEHAAQMLARTGETLAPAAGPVRPLSREVRLYDGKLGPAHVDLLRQVPPPLLLAVREPGGQPSAWEVHLLGTLLRGGPLLPEVPQVVRLWLEHVSHLGAASAEAAALVEAHGGDRNSAHLAAEVMHELAANALLDAPVDAEGRARYAHRRTEVQEVAPEDACSVGLVVLEGRVYLEAADRFGRLTMEPWLRAVESLGGKARVDSSGGGAGLGLRRILEHSDLVAARVVPGRETRVVAVVGLGEGRRRSMLPKSLLYCMERG